MELKLVGEGLQFPEGPVAMADGSVILVESWGRVPTAPPSVRMARPMSATTATPGPGRTAN